MEQVFLYPGSGKVEIVSIVADFKKGELLVEVDGNPKTYAKKSGFLHGLSKYLDSKGLDTLGNEEGEELHWSSPPLRGTTLVFDASQPFLKSWYAKVRRYDMLKSSVAVNAKARLAAASRQEMIDNFLNADWLWVIEGWFHGSAMGLTLGKVEAGSRITPGKYTNKSYRQLLEVLDRFHKLFPQKPKAMYRLISQPKTIELKEGARETLLTALNVIQSWTDNVESAEQFYKDVYKAHPQKGKQYLIVKCYGQPLTTTKTVVQVLEWLYANLEPLHERSTDTAWVNTPVKARRNSVLQSVKSMLVRLKSNMIASQREQIVYAPKPIEVEIVKLFG